MRATTRNVVPSGSERGTLELIQVFRGLAATLVVLYHVTTTNQFYYPFLGYAFRFGHSGVDFFFVLSGFIMVYVNYEKAGAASEAGRFLALRAIRIFLLYWWVLAVTVTVIWMFGQSPDHMWAPASALEPDTLLRAFFLYRQDVDAIVSVAWTLSFELVFYAFFALYFVCGAPVFAALLLTWSGALALQWSGLAQLGSHPVLLRPLIGEFFLGCAAAYVVKRFQPRIAAWWLLVPAALVALTAWAEWSGRIDPYAWWAPPYFLLILIGAAYDHRTRRRYPAWLVRLGEASYAIYLVHYGLIAVFAATIHLWRPTALRAPNLTLTLLAVAILAIGTLVHVVVERPLLATARRRIGLRKRFLVGETPS